MEQQARGCYSEDLKISSEQFVNMMLIDSCFIIELLREAREIDFSRKSVLIRRWMLPVLQRDLIMLENQLLMFVLNKILPTTVIRGVKGDGGSHFLELFRASICPTEVLQKKFLVKEPHMFRLITELKESGVKLKKAEKCQPLDVSFKKGGLKIAPVSLDDYRFTLFRNMVAFEQCHFACKPHVTAYVFFLDRLLNSAEDIELLHYSGVMQHTLGGNKHAARLVNKLCKEVAGAVDDLYLRDVLWKINCYCNDGWNQKRAKLKHEYFYNVWVSLSTMAAILIIYLTILQTISGLGDGDARTHMFGTGFWVSFADAFAIPFGGFKPSKRSSVPVKGLGDEDARTRIFGTGFWVSFADAFAMPFGGFKPSKKSSLHVKDKLRNFRFGYKVRDDMNPFFFMSC
ncbi:hypothetical protein L1987_66418 [Smallanthus sonchifolius]|uniref:Uncharacterized protein n=1 Tax=Smallanthus sonchifolius TaxID=185202 RepID=A0ACB9BX93_9ASTR|nr:hypothetical protein L1987_66418 [Smallanthus sonchifolius]